MPHDPLAKYYYRLPPQERFALIYAAAGRGDETQREALLKTAPRITRTLPGHFPHAAAFDELATFVYLELLDLAARLSDLLELASDYSLDEPPCKRKDSDAERTPYLRTLQLASGTSYMLQTKLRGWQSFCQQLGVPDFLLWKDLPGYDRLQRSLSVAEASAFTSDGMRKWLELIRPAGQPAGEILTVRDAADGLRSLYDTQVAYWDGRTPRTHHS